MEANTEVETSKQLLEYQTHIWNQTLCVINSASLKCAIELGIPDVLHNHGKPMTLSELVDALQIKPEKAYGLQRLMRILVHSSFISQSQPADEHDRRDKERYALTPISQLLLKEKKYNVRAFVMLHLNPITIKTWYSLSDWFHNDDATAFKTSHGEELYEMCSKDLELNNTFHDVMEGDSSLVANEMIRECKGVFDDLTSLVDVGGGTGTVAKLILETFPNLKCTVFDLPHVVGNLQGSQNLSFVGGDMFDTIPPANAILLKSVMHNWGDAECIKILKKCRGVIPSKNEGGKVIIVDMVMNNQSAREYEYAEPVYKAKLLFDIAMMAYHGGKQRSEKEWEQLFTSAGFSQYKITNKLVSRSLIEVYP